MQKIIDPQHRAGHVTSTFLFGLVVISIGTNIKYTIKRLGSVPEIL